MVFNPSRILAYLLFYCPVELSQPDDDRTWKIQIMRAKEDGTTEPTGRVVEVARPIQSSQ